MTKISKKSAYTVKTPVVKDYFVGTDSENNGKTVNFDFESTAKLINELTGNSILNYLFKTSNNIPLEVLTEGVFLSDENETSIAGITKLYVNKKNFYDTDLTDLFRFMSTNKNEFLVTLRNSNNLNNTVYFNIVSITEFADSFTFEVSTYLSNAAFTDLVHFNIYFFNFELKSVVGSSGSDPLKLDKADYEGTATDIDNRIIVLENLQNLGTNFTGQAVAIWTGVGLTYDVFFPDYYIEGILYPGGETSITLDPSDPDYPRQDVIAVDATGLIKITGTPETNPFIPTIDNQKEILITTVLINAGATTPENSTQVVVYKENTEWATSSNNGTVNFNSTSFPFSGTKCVDMGAFTATQYIRFSGTEPLQISDFTFLKLYLYLKQSFANTAKLTFRFINGTTPISSTIPLNNGLYNYDRTVVQTYQNIIIPISDFTFSSATFTGIEIIMQGSNGGGFKLDDFVVAQGSNSASPVQNAITSIITDSGIANATSKDDTFQFKGANGLVVSAIGKIITFTSNFTAALKSNYDAAHTWVMAHGNVDNTSDANKPVSIAQQAALDLKVDKVTGKGLSTEDYTTSEKNKLASIDATHYLAPLQTTVQLSALPQATVSDKARVYVEAELSDYFYDATASSGDIAPDDQVGGVGFWRKVAVGGETAASIKTKYESNADTNAFTNALKAKLDSITEIFTTTLKTGYDGVVTGYNALMATGSRLITSGEITKLSNQSGTNTGDQDLSSYELKNNETTLTDASVLLWNLSTEKLAYLLATSAIGNTRTLPNSVITSGQNSGNYQLFFKQDAVGGRTILFEDSFSVFGDFNTLPNGVTIISIVTRGVDSMVVLTAEVPEILEVKELGFAVSDEDTALVAGTAKLTFRMPYGMNLTEVRSNLKTAPTGQKVIVDINQNGVSILSTKLSIDIGELTSTTASISSVILNNVLVDDAEIVIDIDQIGSTIAGSGLKLWLIGTKI